MADPAVGFRCSAPSRPPSPVCMDPHRPSPPARAPRRRCSAPQACSRAPGLGRACVRVCVRVSECVSWGHGLHRLCVNTHTRCCFEQKQHTKEPRARGGGGARGTDRAATGTEWTTANTAAARAHDMERRGGRRSPRTLERPDRKEKKKRHRSSETHDAPLRGANGAPVGGARLRRRLRHALEKLPHLAGGVDVLRRAAAAPGDEAPYVPVPAHARVCVCVWGGATHTPCSPVLVRVNEGPAGACWRGSGAGPAYLASSASRPRRCRTSPRCRQDTATTCRR